MVEYAKEVCPTLDHEIFFDENWEEFVNNGQEISDEVLHSFEEHVQFDDPVNIQYTSGTTGFPKGLLFPIIIFSITVILLGSD